MGCKLRHQNLLWILFGVTQIALLSLTEKGSATPQSPLTGARPDIANPSTTITDFDARWLMARLLSHDNRHLREAAGQYRRLIAQHPDDPQLRLEFAQVLIRQQDYPTAIAQLKRVLQQRPEDLQAAAALARAYLWSGRPAEAIHLLDRLQKRQPLPVDLLLELARAYTQHQQYDEALNTYHGALSRFDHPTAEIYLEIGDVYLYTNRLTQAISSYRKALELTPGDFSIEKKLGLALSWSGQNQAALVTLEAVHEHAPLDPEVELELARVYAKLGQLDAAVKTLQGFLAQNRNDPDFMAELADLEAARGHIEITQRLYQRAIEVTGQSEEMKLRYAAQMVNWGDFYRAIGLYRQYLQAHPSDAEVRLRLADILTSAQRYEEAEGIYRTLLYKGMDTRRATLGLARLDLQRKDFAAALDSARKYLKLVHGHAETPETDREKIEGLQLEGYLLYRMHRYQEALQVYSRLQEIPSGAVAGLLGTGRTLLAAGESKKAAAPLSRAKRLAPEDVEIRYYLAAACGHDLNSESFVTGLCRPGDYSSGQLLQWGRLYAENGAYRQAIQLYEAVLARDPQNFYARFNLAETLAIDHQYDASIDQLKSLRRDYPEVFKVLLTHARVLGWAGHYEQSIAAYEEMQRMEPTDPLVVREAARTAIWGKRMAEGRAHYRKLWHTRVDEELLQALLTINEQNKDPSLAKMIGELEKSLAKNSIYQGYEAYVEQLSRLDKGTSPQLRTRLREVSLELLPDYRMQKSAHLEAQSKDLAWNKRFARSAETYRKLIEFDAGNEEALFDYAQVLCALGLCHEEAKAYRQLLEIDPLHNRAALALKRQQLRSHPALRAGYSYWQEEGYGELSQMRRQHTDLTADIPLRCRYHLQFVAHQWLEEPIGYSNSYKSYGHTIAFNGVLNAYLEGAAAWTRHYYDNSKLADQDTGFARFAINVKDRAKLELGYDRSNQYFNQFAVLQGIQADEWWLSVSSYITPKLQLRAGARYLNYTDDNDAQVCVLTAGYAFTEHPAILKINLSGEYRNTRETNVYHYDGSELVDITHPYWAPQNYFAGIVGLEWYHDLSRFLFCGSELHYYDIRLSTGTDSDDNPLIAFEAEWHYEFADHWTAQLKGLLHRSQKWDANGFWGTLQYRF